MDLEESKQVADDIASQQYDPRHYTTEFAAQQACVVLRDALRESEARVATASTTEAAYFVARNNLAVAAERIAGLEARVATAREALVEIERRLREDAAPLAAVAQASGKREVEHAWKAVYGSAIHAQGALARVAPSDTLATIDALTKRLDDEAERSVVASMDAARRHSEALGRQVAQVEALRARVADLEARAIPKALIEKPLTMLTIDAKWTHNEQAGVVLRDGTFIAYMHGEEESPSHHSTLAEAFGAVARFITLNDPAALRAAAEE